MTFFRFPPPRIGCGWFLSLILVLAAGASPALAQDDPARDALIVETLLRLESFDLEAKPKTKAAVLRYLAANPGSEPFFKLIERFQIKDAADQLLELAVAKSTETEGVKAAELLLNLRPEAVDAALAGDDAPRAAALVAALGSVGGNAVFDKLAPLVAQEDRPLAIRSAAVQAIGKSKPGIAHLLTTVKEGKLPADLQFATANVLLAAPDPAVQTEARKYLKLPETAGATPLPPLPELLKMTGNAEHGQKLFSEKATCSKCHVVRGQGKEVGPNLSEIGKKLSKEALLVAILDPSAGVSHNYETYVAVTADGKVVSGILVSRTDEQVVLRDAEAIEHTLKTEDLEELTRLPTSLMPSDLQKLMSPQELIDVVEYLMTLK